MRFICPLLVVKDMERSKAFYQTVLHRRVLADLGANVTMEGPFALQTEESWLAFTGLQAEQIRYGGCQSELYFESEDLDGFLERLRFYGEGSYVHSAKQMPWGQRVIRFY
ncbi:MAG: VOC family protein, partial [Christensenellales bacterium]